MGKAGARTRGMILDVAEGLILANGYAATSLNAVSEATRLSKGAFFHHFKDKEALAHALVQRAAHEDFLLLRSLSEFARRKSDDPLQRMILFLKMLERALVKRDAAWGSLRGAFAYQSMQFSEKTDAAIARGFERITGFLAVLLDEILETYRPVRPVAAITLAESLAATMEGAALLARVEGDPEMAARPIALFRKLLPSLFKPEPGRGPSTSPEE